VIAPEYSTPWGFVETISSESNRPNTGNIWVLGCESISLSELDALKDKLVSNGLIVHSEEIIQGQKNFLCPLMYVFWVSDHNDELKLFVLFQFKTEPLGGTPVELINMYRGSKIYRFGNLSDEINLFTLICADVFSFKDVVENHRDSLILHLQLNPSPWNSVFSEYRTNLFEVGSKSHVELVCLNWSKGFSWNVGGQSEIIDHSPNSGFYFPKMAFVKKADSDIDKLDFHGLYYNRPHDHWDCLFLNNSVQAVLLTKSHVRFGGAQILDLPPIVELVKRFVPDQFGNHWIEGVVDDGFSIAVSKFAPLGKSKLQIFQRYEADLNELKNFSPLALDRCFELLLGPSCSQENWYSRYRLNTTALAKNESPQRISVHQEDDQAREGCKARFERLKLGLDVYMLEEVGTGYPEALNDLNQGVKFVWSPTSPHQNIESIDGKARKATLAYLDRSMPGQADSLHNKLLNNLWLFIVKKGAPPSVCAEEYVKAKDRLIIFYLEHGRTEVIHKATNDYSEPFGSSPVDIAGAN
jgi:hypothetical protein